MESECVTSMLLKKFEKQGLYKILMNQSNQFKVLSCPTSKQAKPFFLNNKHFKNPFSEPRNLCYYVLSQMPFKNFDIMIIADQFCFTTGHWISF